MTHKEDSPFNDEHPQAENSQLCRAAASEGDETAHEVAFGEPKACEEEVPGASSETKEERISPLPDAPESNLPRNSAEAEFADDNLAGAEPEACLPTSESPEDGQPLATTQVAITSDVEAEDCLPTSGSPEDGQPLATTQVAITSDVEAEDCLPGSESPEDCEPLATTQATATSDFEPEIAEPPLMAGMEPDTSAPSPPNADIEGPESPDVPLAAQASSRLARLRRIQIRWSLVLWTLGLLSLLIILVVWAASSTSTIPINHIYYHIYAEGSWMNTQDKVQCIRDANALYGDPARLEATDGRQLARIMICNTDEQNYRLQFWSLIGALLTTAHWPQKWVLWTFVGLSLMAWLLAPWPALYSGLRQYRYFAVVYSWWLPTAIITLGLSLGVGPMFSSELWRVPEVLSVGPIFLTCIPLLGMGWWILPWVRRQGLPDDLSRGYPIPLVNESGTELRLSNPQAALVVQANYQTDHDCHHLCVVDRGSSGDLLKTFRLATRFGPGVLVAEPTIPLVKTECASQVRPRATLDTVPLGAEEPLPQPDTGPAEHSYKLAPGPGSHGITVAHIETLTLYVFKQGDLQPSSITLKSIPEIGRLTQPKLLALYADPGQQVLYLLVKDSSWLHIVELKSINKPEWNKDNARTFSVDLWGVEQLRVEDMAPGNTVFVVHQPSDQSNGSVAVVRAGPGVGCVLLSHTETGKPVLKVRRWPKWVEQAYMLSSIGHASCWAGIYSYRKGRGRLDIYDDHCVTCRGDACECSAVPLWHRTVHRRPSPDLHSDLFAISKTLNRVVVLDKRTGNPIWEVRALPIPGRFALLPRLRAVLYQRSAK